MDEAAVYDRSVTCLPFDNCPLLRCCRGEFVRASRLACATLYRRNVDRANMEESAGNYVVAAFFRARARDLLPM